jgi:ATP-dependent Clp protease ATP-binding subunit ClpC
MLPFPFLCSAVAVAMRSAGRPYGAAPFISRQCHELTPLRTSQPLMFSGAREQSAVAQQIAGGNRFAPAGDSGRAATRPRAGTAVMFFDQYDKDAMRLIMDAQTEARNLGVESIGTEHLLLAATLQQDGVAEALKRSGVETKAVREKLRKASGGGGSPLERIFASTSRDELLPFGADTERCLRLALEQAQSEGAALVKPKTLMLSAVDAGEGGAANRKAGGAAKLLASLGIEVESVVDELKRSDKELVGAGDKSARKAKNSTLAQCSIDLTERAREGKLDPCVGREDEVSAHSSSGAIASAAGHHAHCTESN